MYTAIYNSQFEICFDTNMKRIKQKVMGKLIFNESCLTIPPPKSVAITLHVLRCYDTVNDTHKLAWYSPSMGYFVPAQLVKEKRNSSEISIQTESRRSACLHTQ